MIQVKAVRMNFGDRPPSGIIWIAGIAMPAFAVLSLIAMTVLFNWPIPKHPWYPPIAAMMLCGPLGLTVGMKTGFKYSGINLPLTGLLAIGAIAQGVTGLASSLVVGVSVLLPLVAIGGLLAWLGFKLTRLASKQLGAPAVGLGVTVFGLPMLVLGLGILAVVLAMAPGFILLVGGTVCLFFLLDTGRRFSRAGVPFWWIPVALILGAAIAAGICFGIGPFY